MGNVGQAMYASKWYVLNVRERKDFVMLLMMGHKIKTLKAGFLGAACLGRFATVRKYLFLIKI